MTDIPPKRPAVVCDLDGTLALIGDRDPYDAQECGLDAVNRPVALILGWATRAGHAVILVSGRGFDASHRPATERWLAWNQVGYDVLHMRPVGDPQPDWQLKARIYRERIQPFFQVAFWLDDRQSVVDAIRGLGVPVFQVDQRIE